jgi:hypothetical protein
MGEVSDVQAGPEPFYESAVWDLKFAWLPQRCDKTGEEIWFKWAYRGVARGGYTNEPRFNVRWLTKDEWMIGKLKGTI